MVGSAVVEVVSARRRPVPVGALVVSAAAAALVAGGAAVLWARRRPAGVPTSGTFAASAVEGRELVAGTELRLTFADGRLFVYAGGNYMAGSLAVAGPHVVWLEEAATSAGLLPQLAVQDAWVAAWLAGGVMVFRDGGDVVLAGGGVRVVLRPADPTL
jgi:hypothetical protein